PHLLDHAFVVVSAHEALERRQRPRGEHVQVGQLARGQRNLLARLNCFRPLARTVDERTAVRADEEFGRARHGAHAFTADPTSPSSSSLATTSWALSPGSCASVSSTSSGRDGVSYGSSTPVKPLISP